jgi:PAS domain S-box-containing protein
LIITSGTESSRSAVEAMRAGAVNFIVMTGYSLTNLPLIATNTVSEWQRTLTDLHLQEFNERAARILEYLPDFVGIADSDGRIMFVNRVGRAMLGAKSNDDISGEHMHRLFPDWEVGDFIYPDASREEIEMKWNPNARMKTCAGKEVSAKHAVFAYVSPTSEVEYFTIVAREERKNGRGRH